METDVDDAFQLHPRLAADTHLLGSSGYSMLLLMNNARVPWFIQVPKTAVLELHRLPLSLRAAIREETDAIATFVEAHFRPDKLNIATIGNLVPQLHIHVIGRFEGDDCWPAPVWGRLEPQDYDDAELGRIRTLVRQDLGIWHAG